MFLSPAELPCPSIEKKFDKFLADHNANIQVREATASPECVTASCLTPLAKAAKEVSAFPYPDTYYKIVKVNTTEEGPVHGEEGEICLTGPTMMLGYLNNPEETAETLKKHADGLTWLHTGDLGMMDEDGFVYFRQRIKRMIVSSGYNIYPSALENIFDAHEKVLMSCIIGVLDEFENTKNQSLCTVKTRY